VEATSKPSKPGQATRWILVVINKGIKREKEEV